MRDHLDIVRMTKLDSFLFSGKDLFGICGSVHKLATPLAPHGQYGKTSPENSWNLFIWVTEYSLCSENTQILAAVCTRTCKQGQEEDCKEKENKRRQKAFKERVRLEKIECKVERRQWAQGENFNEGEKSRGRG